MKSPRSYYPCEYCDKDIDPSCEPYKTNILYISSQSVIGFRENTFRKLLDTQGSASRSRTIDGYYCDIICFIGKINSLLPDDERISLSGIKEEPDEKIRHIELD